MIQVYEIGYNNFASMGMGSITPVSCNVHEEQSAGYELEMVCAMDESLNYELLMEGRVLRVPVPVSTTPIYKIRATETKEYWRGGGSIYSNQSTNIGYTKKVTRERKYRVKLKKPKPGITVFRVLWYPIIIPLKWYEIKTKTWTEDVWVPGDSSIVAEIEPNTEVIVVEKTANWLKVVTADGQTGWIERDKMTYARTVPERPNETIQKKKIRNQLFRIYRVEKDTNALQVRAWARHISYDLMGNVVMEGVHTKVQLDALLDQITMECSQPDHGFHIYTDQPDMWVYDVNVKHKNIIEALLDPDDGIIAKTNLRLVRDNFDLYLTNANQEQRAPITYGHNLMGVTLDINDDEAVNRIIPVGTDKDGEPVLIDGRWIDSPRNDENTIIRAKVIEYSEAKEKEPKEATESSPAEPGVSIAEVKTRLTELAQEEFDKGIDLPNIDMKIDFIQLGDTEEYKQYRDLDRLYMGDLVQVIDLVHGIDVDAEVTEYDFDCLANRYTKIGVGITGARRAAGSVGSFMLSDGSLGGRKIAMGSVDGSRIANMSIGAAKIGLAAIETAHIKKATINDLMAGSIEAVKAKIHELAAGQITTDQLYADLAAIAVAQITTANIDHANISWADISNLSATIADVANAQIDTAKIDYAKITDMATNTAIITKGEAGKLYIANLAVTDANMLQLTAGKLMLKAQDGNFVQLVADGSGGVSTQPVEVKGDNIANSTISGGKLIENSITARELNVQQIFADEALIRAIKAKNLDVADLFAAEATISELNNYILRTSTIEAIKGKLNVWAEDKINIAVGPKADKTITDALDARLTTAEQKITPTAITQTVRSSAQYMQDLAGKQPVGDYATTSQISQLSDNVTISVKSDTSGKKLLYKDPIFQQGLNGLWTYNTAFNKQVLMERVAIGNNEQNPTDSTHAIRITVKTGALPYPDYGGFFQTIQSNKNKVFIVKYIIMLPVGYKLQLYSNPMGDEFKDYWLTDNKGTGKFTEYIRRIECGASGDFSFGGHIAVSTIDGSSPPLTSPLVWWLAGIWSYDITTKEDEFKTSSVSVRDDGVYVQGGTVNLEAGSDMAIKSGANFDLTANDLVLSNNRSDGIAMMSGGNSIANAPYWLTREGELNFSKLSDGATAMLDNMFKVEFYSGSVAPNNSIGINGALYVLHSASVGSTWSDTAASIPSAQGMQTWFGVYRNWNVLESGCRYIGNGKGTASTKNGVYFTFSAPATMSNATFVFVTNKRHPTQSYYLSTGTTTYRLEIRSGSAAGSLVGRKDFSAGTSQTTQTVSVNGNFTKGTTYYCGIFYPESTELTNCTIVGGITLKGSSSSKEFGLYVKSNGSWKELIK